MHYSNDIFYVCIRVLYDRADCTGNKLLGRVEVLEDRNSDLDLRTILLEECEVRGVPRIRCLRPLIWIL